MKMGGLSSDNFHARKKSAMVKLVKGREFAIQLQTILREAVQDHEPAAVQRLADQIYRSLSDSLSDLSFCTGSTEWDQIPAPDCGGSASSAESKKKPGVKDRRGCYKRRRTSDSWVKVSPTMEDGCAWRKYGQKTILNSEYPRCYFRCTHKSDGCKALKQVQRLKGDQMLYQTTYFNHHTCKSSLLSTPPPIMESDPINTNLISFQSLKKQNQEDNDDCNKDSSISTLEDPWQHIIGLDNLGYNPPFQDEVESSLHVFDMEGINHLYEFPLF